MLFWSYMQNEDFYQIIEMDAWAKEEFWPAAADRYSEKLIYATHPLCTLGTNCIGFEKWMQWMLIVEGTVLKIEIAKKYFDSLINGLKDKPIVKMNNWCK